MTSDYIKDTLKWLLTTYCNEREQWVIKKRFGLESEDYRGMLLEDVAKEYPWGKVTRERIRLIEAQGLRKMRPHLGTRLDEFDWMLALLPYLHLAKAVKL